MKKITEVSTEERVESILLFLIEAKDIIDKESKKFVASALSLELSLPFSIMATAKEMGFFRKNGEGILRCMRSKFTLSDAQELYKKNKERTTKKAETKRQFKKFHMVTVEKTVQSTQNEMIQPCIEKFESLSPPNINHKTIGRYLAAILEMKRLADKPDFFSPNEVCLKIGTNNGIMSGLIDLGYFIKLGDRSYKCLIDNITIRHAKNVATRLKTKYYHPVLKKNTFEIEHDSQENTMNNLDNFSDSEAIKEIIKYVKGRGLTLELIHKFDIKDLISAIKILGYKGKISRSEDIDF